MTKDWVAKIAAEMPIDDLPESYQAVAEIIGKDLTFKLARHLGGAGFYFRKLDSLLLSRRDEKIRANFTGVNQRELAREYDLTERQIRNILRSKPPEQTKLFEEDTK
jgi:Mor family transcriptional regulator